jgi:hypothetical protein
MFGEQLINKIREVQGTKIRFDYENKDVLLENLKFLYHACKASEELLLDGGLFCEGYDDEFTRGLGKYYEEHYHEEKDELRILIKDLEKSGINAAELPWDRVAMQMIGTQYYLIKHVHPVCLLGYMAIQEANPTDMEVVKWLESKHGKILNFIHLHAVKDLEHRKELIEILNSVPKEKEPLVIDSVENALWHLHLFSTKVRRDN